MSGAGGKKRKISSVDGENAGEENDYQQLEEKNGMISNDLDGDQEDEDQQEGDDNSDNSVDDDSEEEYDDEDDDEEIEDDNPTKPDTEESPEEAKDESRPEYESPDAIQLDTGALDHKKPKINRMKLFKNAKNKSKRLIVILEKANLEIVKVGKNFELITCDDHMSQIRKYKKDPAFCRPDITHQV